ALRRLGAPAHTSGWGRGGVCKSRSPALPCVCSATNRAGLPVQDRVPLRALAVKAAPWSQQTIYVSQINSEGGRLMSLLAVDAAGKPHVYKIEVDAATDAELRLYARFANNSTPEKVAKAGLKHMVEKLFPTDEEFQKWKQNPDNLKAPEPRRRRRKTNGQD